MRSLSTTSLLLVLALQSAAAQQTVPLAAGMVIDRSIVVRPGPYPRRIPGGTHKFRLEYYDLGVVSELTFNIQKRS